LPKLKFGLVLGPPLKGKVFPGKDIKHFLGVSQKIDIEKLAQRKFGGRPVLGPQIKKFKGRPELGSP